jgi:4-amino-4-deoxy-L-arabinose transferase-like glycosyltransferase
MGEDQTATARINERSFERHDGSSVTASQVALVLLALFVLNLVLRVFYLRYDFVNGDEGVRALTAVRWLEGARLYVEVVTDKPPGATLFYALVFKVFGQSMNAVHLAAAVWNFLTATAVYGIASRFVSRQTGLVAAALFVYFSTNYLTQDMMAANTELLMVLPYTIAFGSYLRSSHGLAHGTADQPSRSSSMALLFTAGLLTGIAALFKQVAVLNLVFFAVYETWGIWSARKSLDPGMRRVNIRRAVARMSIILAGFALVLGFLWFWLWSTGAASEFWKNAVVVNALYVDSERLSIWLKLKFLLGRGLSYILFNIALWVPALLAVARAFRNSSERATAGAYSGERDSAASVPFAFARASALWGFAGVASVALGGRFFGHYFIPLLPALSLLAAIEVQILRKRLKAPGPRLAAKALAGALLAAFVFGLVRFHQRTAILAYEAATGRRTESSAGWGMTQRQREAEVVSQFVRSRLGPGEPLFIWGYAHDVFWQTGCRPASRYLAPYFIDGRFPDSEASPVSPSAAFWQQARANLIEDLTRSRPKLILEVGERMRSLPYRELARFIRANYRETGVAGPEPQRPFRVLELKEKDRGED